MARFFNAAYRADIARCTLLFTRHGPPSGSRVTAYQRLPMPFARNVLADILVIANLVFVPDRVPHGPLGDSE